MQILWGRCNGIEAYFGTGPGYSSGKSVSSMSTSKGRRPNHLVPSAHSDLYGAFPACVKLYKFTLDVGYNEV